MKLTTRHRRKQTQSAGRTRVPVAVKIEPRQHQQPTPPILFLTNPQSLTNVYAELYACTTTFKPDIIRVSETWFSPNKPAHLYNLNGYELFNKDRATRGGGVALFLKDTLAIRPVNIIVPENLECVWIMVEQPYL